MKYRKTLFLSALLILSAMFMSGCSDYVGKEKSHPLFVKAGASRAAGNYKEAAQFYEDFLYVCPKSPLAHLELASVYADNLDDPFRAMYHYEKYLELEPNSPDAADIKKFSAACRKRIFDKFSKDYQSDEVAKAQRAAERYRKKLDEYIEYSNRLLAEYKKLKERFERGTETRVVHVRPLRAVEQPAVTEPASEGAEPAAPARGTEVQRPPAKPAIQPAAASGTREYTVVSGDTLMRISKKVYGSSKYWRKIKEANPGKIGPNDGVRIGVTLVIPDLGGGR